MTTFATWSTSIFLIGWATGGLVFGMFGDRIGRVRTLTLTILLYSCFTGLSAASVTVWDFCAYRFLTGLGVGGVFSAAVALLAETMPSHARPYTLGLMQAMSAIGNCTAAALFIILGLLELNGHLASIKPLNAWRLMFLIGIAPAVLVIFIQRWLEEPHSWQKARDAAQAGTGKRLGSYGDLFGVTWIRRHALLGLVLSFVGVVGLWGIGFFSIDLAAADLPADFHSRSDGQRPLARRAGAIHQRPKDHLGRHHVLHAQYRRVLRHDLVQLGRRADRTPPGICARLSVRGAQHRRFVLVHENAHRHSCG